MVAGAIFVAIFAGGWVLMAIRGKASPGRVAALYVIGTIPLVASLFFSVGMNPVLWIIPLIAWLALLEPVFLLSGRSPFQMFRALMPGHTRLEPEDEESRLMRR